MISNATAFEVLCLQAADQGRGEALLGNCVERARNVAAPFVLPGAFPSVYLEFPLVGAPFMDVTILYEDLEPGANIASDAAGDVGALLDWYAAQRKRHEDVSFGFELDTSKDVLPMAAIHFQPRGHEDLVMPFCELVGESGRGALYLSTAKRMPGAWPLSFFGMFRGRPNSPLRVCGYLDDREAKACVEDKSHLQSVFEAVGFSAYDEAMLAQVCELLSVAPVGVDFQFDVHADGTLGDTFALDLQFGIEAPEAVRKSYDSGLAGRMLGTLGRFGAADERWRLSADAAFARALPMELDDGSMGRYQFVLMPRWVKARWRNGVLQPSKLYLYGTAGLSDNP